MSIKINGIELELEDGASVEVAPDGKITIKAGELIFPSYPFNQPPVPIWPTIPVYLSPNITWTTPPSTRTVCKSGNILSIS